MRISSKSKIVCVCYRRRRMFTAASVTCNASDTTRGRRKKKKDYIDANRKLKAQSTRDFRREKNVCQRSAKDFFSLFLVKIFSFRLTIPFPDQLIYILVANKIKPRLKKNIVRRRNKFIPEWKKKKISYSGVLERIMWHITKIQKLETKRLGKKNESLVDAAKDQNLISVLTWLCGQRRWRRKWERRKKSAVYREGVQCRSNKVSRWMDGLCQGCTNFFGTDSNKSKSFCVHEYRR